MRSARTWLLTLSLLLPAAAQTLAAEPAAPPPPAHYKVTIRYQISAARNEHVRLFREMVHHLGALGFEKDPGPEGEEEDPALTLLTGTVASDKAGTAREKAHRFLLDPYAKAVLLVPADYQVPAEAEKPVKVQIDLTPGLPLERQRLLAEQLLDRLRTLGFRESVGYHNRGHTRMVGTIPAGNLTRLLRDMRWQPSGWLLPETPVAELPRPIRSVSPIQVVEVLPEPAGEAAAGKELPPLQPLPPELFPGDKVGADVRAFLDQKEAAAQSHRMEVILSFIPSDLDRDWQKTLTRRAPGLVVEGRLGPILTVRARPDQAPRLADVPFVSTIRLPHPALLSTRVPGAAADNARTLHLSGVERLHAHGYRGAGLRVAVIDSDFRGYDRYLGKGLPARVTVVDLTQETRPSFQPEPYPDDGVAVGQGTECALALALAAPAAEMTLVRIDPAAPYQLLSAAHYLNADVFVSYDIENRNQQLADEDENLQERRTELARERRGILNNFGQDPESVKRRQEYFRRAAELEKDERTHADLYDRLQRMIAERRQLRGNQVVSCSLVWNEGYPLAGSGALSRYLDDAPFRGGLWFQSAGNTRGQSWSGLFRDRDGNRVMEFSAAPQPPRPDLWTNELNFLSWTAPTGQPGPDLPANATVRVTLQWREPHDAEFAADADDVYRRPLATIRLVALRQLDPEGKTRPADDLEVVAWTSGLPERLENRPDAATYEVVLEFKTPVAGRYALRVEGIVPPGLRPPELTLPGPQPGWEMRPRIFVETMDAASRKTGRPIFRDYYTTDVSSLGIPGDAQQVLTVGAVGPTGVLRPYSAGGPPARSLLLFKPDLVGYDDLQVGAGQTYGTDLATAFGAGLMASRFSAGVSPREFLESAGARPGSLVRAPEVKPARPRK